MPLPDYMSGLEPGDKLTIAIQKMKPTWLSQQGESAGAAPAAQPAPAPMGQAQQPAPQGTSLTGPSRESLMAAMGQFNPGV